LALCKNKKVGLLRHPQLIVFGSLQVGKRHHQKTITGKKKKNKIIEIW
jgi:hypothetical protein